MHNASAMLTATWIALQISTTRTYMHNILVYKFTTFTCKYMYRVAAAPPGLPGAAAASYGPPEAAAGAHCIT